MKKLPIILLSLVCMSFTPWKKSVEIEKAKVEAINQHKLILLNFSGSDWCGPCIRMEKEFFESDVFSNFATNNLVLVNADFPRQKKNQLSKEEQKQNEALAEKYNNKGAFPFTVLIDASGKVLKTWDGLPKEKPEEFTHEISAITDASK
jgi:thioredoxin-related protein